MTREDKYDEVAESFFVNVSRYIDENKEIDLNRQVMDYIKNEDYVLDIKISTDPRHFTNIVVNTLVKNDYFEFSANIKNIKMYKPTQNCNERLRIIKQRGH